MLTQTAQLLLQITVLNSKLAMLQDAANQIALVQTRIGSLTTQLTALNDPDAAAVQFVNAQIATLQTTAAAAATALAPLNAAAPALNTAAPETAQVKTA